MRPARMKSPVGMCVVGALLLSLCASTYGQSPVDAGKLPSRTLFYLHWHGTPSGEARKNSSVFALWDDPQLAKARSSFLESMVNNSPNTSKPKVSREEFEEYVTLLDNPFVIGYLRQPEAARKTEKAAGDQPKAPAWNGLFFIYDRSGKEALLSKAVLHLRSAETEIPKLTEITVAGVPSLKVERKGGITYWAEFGKYAVSANEMAVFEEILNVVNGKSSAEGLGQTAAYREAQAQLGGGILEFFLEVPNAEQIAMSAPDKSTAQLRALLSTLKLDSVHSVAGRVSVEGTRTRVVGAVLGDAAPGGLFDMWGDGQMKPASMDYVTGDTIYFGESQFNLLGIYGVLKHAFTSPGAEKSGPSPLEQMAETRLGMPLEEALRVVTGEVAWFQTSPVMDDKQKVYLIGINDKANALKLTRTLMGDRIASERAEGDTTLLKVSLQGGQGKAGVAQWNFYHLAMTPKVLVGTYRSESLQSYMKPGPGSEAKGLLAAREQFPEKLNGFSYLDFQKLDWAGLQKKWVEDANKEAETATSTEGAASDKKRAEWLSQVDPQVFPRHLHTMTGASWKDAKGVHFDEWVE